MKRYELKYTEGEAGVFRMSTVESPATKTRLVMFDNELELLEFKDDEKQVIYSVAMRPNIDIPRKNINGEPAMVFYTEETADSLLENFFKTGANLGATVNHDKNIRNDMFIFSAWKVLDSEKDPAAIMGMKVEKGDIVMGQKVNNPEVWAKVKNNELQGFSIEAYLEPVLINNEIEMTTEELDARIKIVLMASQLGTEYDVDGTKYYIDKIEVGGMVTDADGKPLKIEGILIDGKSVESGDNGLITAVEVPAEEKVDMELPPAGEDLQKKVDELTAENNDLKAKLAELEGKQTNMSAELVAAKKVALEFSEQITKGIPPSGAKEKMYAEMNAYERTLFNKNKK